MLQMKKKYTTYGKLLYIGLFVALYGLFRYKPALTEQWYSTGLYPYIGRTVRFLLGWILFLWGMCSIQYFPWGHCTISLGILGSYVRVLFVSLGK